MSDKWISVDDKIEVVQNRLRQLSLGYYDKELNFRTAEAEGRHEQASELKAGLIEFSNSIDFHEKELEKLRDEKDTVHDHEH